ncbi:MAG: Ldh family oxidoreductase [Nitrososphaerales archaeon]
MYLIQHNRLREIGIKIFEQLGASKEEAEIVANHLVESNLVGHDSHGVVRIPEYVGRIIGKPILKIEAPPIKLKAKIKVIRETPTTALIDGDWGFGQVVARRAMEIAIKKAKDYQVGLVAARNCDHVGRAGEFPLMASEQDMIGALFVKTVPVMAPVGGRGRVIGNNPISIAIPANDGKPILLDFAMSVAAGGKIIMAIEKGENIPEGWIIDSEGNPSTNPKDYINGGALLPFARHKGYALSVIVEVLGGILSGVGALADYKGINTFLAMAIDIEAFIPLKEFKEKVDKLIRDIKSAQRIGVEEILLPGEPELKTKERRIKEGIPIPEKTWNDIVEIARKLKVKI